METEYRIQRRYRGPRSAFLSDPYDPPWINCWEPFDYEDDALLTFATLGAATDDDWEFRLVKVTTEVLG